MDTLVRVKDNTGNIKSAVDDKIRLALQAMGEVVEGYAKDDCPVETGRLRNSITHERYDTHIEAVGSRVEYAPYVEFIDRYSHTVGKAHFLRDAGQNHISELKKIAETVLSAKI